MPESMIEADPYVSVGVVLGRLEHDGNLIEADIGALNSFALQGDAFDLTVSLSLDIDFISQRMESDPYKKPQALSIL